MASNKDILEAQRYNRRRLVTAFTSGTPGGREIESRSPMRPLILGVALSLVLVGVAAIMGRFAPTLTSGWQNDTVIVEKGTGTRYYAIDGVLRPIANITSARLLADASKYRVLEVDASALAGVPRGTGIGIPEAPDTVPAATSLRSTQWTACASTAGATHTWIGGDPAQREDAEVALVSGGGALYLLADGRRHLIPAQDTDAVKFGLRLDTAAVHNVDAGFLDLFQRGADLAPHVVPNAGAPAAGKPVKQSRATIGTVIEVNDGASTRRYVITGAGQITPLTDVAFRLLTITTGATSPLTTDMADVAGLKVADPSALVSDWPDELGAPVDADHLPCSTLRSRDNALVATLTAIPVGMDSGRAVSVVGGSGALVRAVSGGTFGALSLITDQGLAYGLDNPLDTLARLGYVNENVTDLPTAWVALVPAGISLSNAAALATVTAK